MPVMPRETTSTGSVCSRYGASSLRIRFSATSNQASRPRPDRADPSDHPATRSRTVRPRMGRRSGMPDGALRLSRPTRRGPYGVSVPELGLRGLDRISHRRRQSRCCPSGCWRLWPPPGWHVPKPGWPSASLRYRPGRLRCGRGGGNSGLPRRFDHSRLPLRPEEEVPKQRGDYQCAEDPPQPVTVWLAGWRRSSLSRRRWRRRRASIRRGAPRQPQQEPRPQRRQRPSASGGIRRPRPHPHWRSRLPGWCDRSLAAQDCGTRVTAGCPLSGNREDNLCPRWHAPRPPESTRPTRCPPRLPSIDRHQDRRNRQWRQANPRFREPIQLLPRSGTQSEIAEAHQSSTLSSRIAKAVFQTSRAAPRARTGRKHASRPIALYCVHSIRRLSVCSTGIIPVKHDGRRQISGSDCDHHANDCGTLAWRTPASARHARLANACSSEDIAGDPVVAARTAVVSNQPARGYFPHDIDDDGVPATDAPSTADGPPAADRPGQIARSRAWPLGLGGNER